MSLLPLKMRSRQIAATATVFAVATGLAVVSAPRASIESLASAPIVITAVGDFACDTEDPRFSAGNGTSIACQQKAVSDQMLTEESVSAFLGLGDYQYDCGDPSDWAASYTPTWGRLNSWIDPSAGNHEYKTGTDKFGDPCPASNVTAETYFDYFGPSAHPETVGHYSFDLGAWHLVALNANCTRKNVGGCSATSAQTNWLRADLAASIQPCTLAFWHEPLYQGLKVDYVSAYKPWWDLLLDHGADIVLNGHTHNYQRYPAMDSAKHLVADGITQYVVGTGGEEQVAMKSTGVQPEYWRKDFGYLRLALGDAGWDSVFVNAQGVEFDSHSGTCGGTNVAPTADFEPACAGARCTFDASASRDPDGSIQDYLWDFGDGSTGTGSTATHTYGTDDTFEVSLTVTDNRGESSSTSRSVSAANEGPVAEFDVVCEGLACTLDASGSSDIDGSIVSYDWTIGDGSTEVGKVVKHDFADDGTYPIELVVTDDRGKTDVIGRDAVVANQAPVADFSVVCEGLVCALNASGSSDADGSIVSYDWTMGDGTSLTGVEATHEYLAEGTYSVALTVTDDRFATREIQKDVSVGLSSNSTEFVAAEAVGGPSSSMPSVAIPLTAEVGDTLLLFVSNGSSRTPAVPGGWMSLGTEVDDELRTDVYWRMATDSDAGQRVAVALLNSSGVPQSAPNTLTVAAYSGVLSPPVSAFTSAVEPSGSYVGEHTTPDVTVPTDGSWVVSYWADRTSNTSRQSATSSWALPVGQQLRADAYNTVSGGRVTSLLTDDGSVSPVGPRQGLTATANGQTKKATLWSIVLRGS